MATCNPAVDSVFMLKAYQVIPVEVQKLCGPLVGTQIFLFELQANLLRILIA